VTRTEIAHMLWPLIDKAIVGGCDHCDAYQIVKPITAGAWKVTVHHDEWCRWQQRRGTR
jgi:hypothetical protein